MVKTVAACVFSVLFGVQSFGQFNQFPNGVYLTLDQLKKHTPAYNTSLVMQRRSAHEIRYNGGNEYRLVSKKDSLSQHYIKKKMFAYVKNDSVYLNCNEMDLGNWYTLAITKGNFMAFNARDIEPDRTKNATQTGLLGYALAKTTEEINWSRYVLSLRSGYLTPLRKDYVMKRLREKMDLLEQFVQEKEKDSFATMYRYLDLLNETIPSDSDKEE